MEKIKLPGIFWNIECWNINSMPFNYMFLDFVVPKNIIWLFIIIIIILFSIKHILHLLFKIIESILKTYNIKNYYYTNNMKITLLKYVLIHIDRVVGVSISPQICCYLRKYVLYIYIYIILYIIQYTTCNIIGIVH